MHAFQIKDLTIQKESKTQEVRGGLPEVDTASVKVSKVGREGDPRASTHAR